MAMKEIDKLIIADEMLDVAIDQFLSAENYFVAINLAGVAEELYGKMLRISGKRDMQSQLVDDVIRDAAAQGVTHISRKEWKKTSVFNKNSIKHFDSEDDRYIEIDAFTEARLTIAQAYQNFLMLEREPTQNTERFLEFAQEFIKAEQEGQL